MAFNLDFYRGRNVLVTGHTGFKGTWLCKILIQAGANVTGYALEPSARPNLFELAQIRGEMNSIIGDIRDFDHLRDVFEEAKPEVVFHLAAQSLVRQSYLTPAYTYETNVMGTVNVLECIRTCASVKSFLNVTTDKVYQNQELSQAFKEEEPLDGYDPYSNSKSCSELVTHCYKNSFFADGRCVISTARAGNVIGGGDFAADRIIPDCVRAAEKKETIVIRNPYSVRPYQHVLEPLFVYLMIAERQYRDIQYAGYYNVGPDECDCLMTGELAELFCSKWGDGISWESASEENAPHEAKFLKLNCSKLKQTFGWHPCWNIAKAVEHVVAWTKVYLENGDIPVFMKQEIIDFFEEARK